MLCSHSPCRHAPTRSAAHTVAALEHHAQHLLLRVLLSGPPESASAVDATQGLAFLAQLFNAINVVSVGRKGRRDAGRGQRGGGEVSAAGRVLVPGGRAHLRAVHALAPLRPCTSPQLRLLCVALGESFCAGDVPGQAAAARLLVDAPPRAFHAGQLELPALADSAAPA